MSRLQLFVFDACLFIGWALLILYGYVEVTR